MVLTLFRYFWNPVTGDRGALPEEDNAPAPVSGRERRKRLEEETVLEQRHREEEQEERDRNQDSEFLWMWLLSLEGSRAHAELLNVLADARAVVLEAHKDAVLGQQAAQKAFEDLQGKAIVLSDGRRVYFTRDGIRLYGEDDQEIIDARLVREAAEQARRTPDAPSYEEFIERRKSKDQAEENVQRLESALQRLDELRDKAKTGKLSPQEIEEAHAETQNILNSLPPEVRDRYDRLREAGNGKTQLVYRAVDPGFDATPVMHEDFKQATSAASQDRVADANDKPVTGPAYKAAPPF